MVETNRALLNKATVEIKERMVEENRALLNKATVK